MKELTDYDLIPDLTKITVSEADVDYSVFQKRALNAIQELVYTNKVNPIMMLTTTEGIDVEELIPQLLNKCESNNKELHDICYAENLTNDLSPVWLHIKSGTAEEFNTLICDLLNKVKRNLNAEEILLRILKKQGDNKKLEDYLSDLSIHVAKGQDFAHPVLMNLMVCHEANVPPIIFGRDITWKKLFGGVNYLTENGTTYSHQHLLEAGLLRRADGGFLVLSVEELVHNPYLWFKLKHSLQAGVLDWDNPTDINNTLVPFFAPEPTPIDVKVILYGNVSDIYSLYNYDQEYLSSVYTSTDLKIYFKLDEYGNDFAKFISQLAQSRGLLPISIDAINRIIRECCRRAESQTEFLFNTDYLLNVLREASGIAFRAKKEEIDLDCVIKTFNNREYRVNSVVEESSEFYKSKQMLLKTDGEEIGQINGLTVVHTSGEDFEYGEPARITATIHSGGEGNISDVEHRAELAGQIHAKAMMIINGYLTNLFGAANPIPVTPNLVFEQSYCAIDGDSASLTGLCAILSALSHLPIKQQFALTGSLDQFGNVQPVGGLNEKIEGFYRVCKIQGITGKQGVIIPESNVQALVLSDEVREAVNQKKFHIYAVKSVDETIELLTGTKAGLMEAREELIKRVQGLNSNDSLKEDCETNERTVYKCIEDYFDYVENDEEQEQSFWSKLKALF